MKMSGEKRIIGENASAFEWAQSASHVIVEWRVCGENSEIDETTKGPLLTPSTPLLIGWSERANLRKGLYVHRLPH